MQKNNNKLPNICEKERKNESSVKNHTPDPASKRASERERDSERARENERICMCNKCGSFC